MRLGSDQRGAAIAPALLALAVARCDRPSPPAHGRSDARAAVSRADAGASGLVAEVDHPRPLPGPLAACVRRVTAATPTELGAALEALSYANAAEDGCRLELATSARDPSLCDEVLAPGLRGACRARAVAALGRPDDCPDSVLDHGRDPFCVAIASRSPALCHAAPTADRVRCLAVTRADARVCAPLEPILRARCLRDVRALGGLFARRRPEPAPAASCHVRLTIAASPDGGVRTRDYDLPLLSRGVYLDSNGTVWLLDPMRGWPSPLASSLASDAPIVAASIAPPSRPNVVATPARPAAGRLVDLRIVMPTGPALDLVPGAPSVAQWTAIPKHRLDPVAGSLVAQASAEGLPVTVEITFRSYVRDVVTPDVLGAVPPAAP